ncbi:large ribosomal subunit protein mL37 [Stigmatopora argus]
MFQETIYFAAGSLRFSQSLYHRNWSWFSSHGGERQTQARHFYSSQATTRRAPIVKELKEKVHIPGLDNVTYWEKMHYVPGLAKPVTSPWKTDYKDPKHYRSPPSHQMPLYQDTPCYVFNQRTNALEGVRQALWLTKSKAVSGLPPELLSLVKISTNQIPHQEKRVQNAIRHACFWDTTEQRPIKYSKTLLFNLLHLCATLQSSHPLFGRRMLAENYSLAASWKRGKNLFQVRGQNGLLYRSMDPLPRISGEQQVSNTADEDLDTFYPVSPTVDLQKVHVYDAAKNCTGFKRQHFYPHAHTLYFLDDGAQCKLRPDQFRAKMIMFLFGNALAQAHRLFGTKTYCALDHPITLQAVGTNGRLFQFIVLQLNTTDLKGDNGIKNQVWVDEDAELYDFPKVRPFFFKKQLKEPIGLSGFKPETFTKFLALFLHGAV